MQVLFDGHLKKMGGGLVSQKLHFLREVHDWDQTFYSSVEEWQSLARSIASAYLVEETGSPVIDRRASKASPNNGLTALTF